MEQQGTEGLIFAIIGLLGLCIIVVFLFMIFQKKKNFLLFKQIEAKKQFEKEIIESQIEIREQSLYNISWELHDNIGQLLTLAKIQLQNIPIHPDNVKEINDNLTTILNEVRVLSKTTNPDFISKIKLIEALKLEIDRFNRLNYIKSDLKIIGEPFEIDPKTEIVIFRMLQEFFSNTIKHSKATELNVLLNFDANKVFILAVDNGIGFDTSLETQNGIGINNMKKRGALINANVNIVSEKNNGTKLSIDYIKFEK